VGIPLVVLRPAVGDMPDELVPVGPRSPLQVTLSGATVEPIRLPPKALVEDALPTDAEIQALFESADDDVFGQMSDVIRLYFHTGDQQNRSPEFS
jgi:hypothetical protein